MNNQIRLLARRIGKETKKKETLKKLVGKKIICKSTSMKILLNSLGS